jgi:hypothetical protein
VYRTLDPLVRQNDSVRCRGTYYHNVDHRPHFFSRIGVAAVECEGHDRKMSRHWIYGRRPYLVWDAYLMFLDCLGRFLLRL